MSIFEKASRLQLRWNVRGNNTVEDLWQLPLKDLDTTYDILCRSKEGNAHHSLLEDVSGEDEVLALKIKILEHVILTRLAEVKQRKEQAANKAYKQKIAAIIESKEDEALFSKGVDELKKLLAED